MAGDFANIEEYIDGCSDVNLKNEVLGDIDYYYNGEFNKVVIKVGEIAEVNGWGIGWGIQ